MSLEISEISIRLAVGEPLALAPDPPAGERLVVPALAAHEIDELVRRCVQDVIAALRQMGDR